MSCIMQSIGRTDYTSDCLNHSFYLACQFLCMNIEPLVWVLLSTLIMVIAAHILRLLSLANGQYIWQYAYPYGTQNCAGTPTIVSSFFSGQCYNSGIGGFKHVISGTTITTYIYSDATCTKQTLSDSLASGACSAGIYKTIIQSNYVIPSYGFIYYERYSATACTSKNNVRVVLRPGVCSYTDSVSGYIKGTMGSLTSATLGFTKDLTGQCPSVTNVVYSTSSCKTNNDFIMNAFSATAAASIGFGTPKVLSYTSLSIPITLNWPSPMTMKVEIYNGASYDATSCTATTNGQTCTITNVKAGIATNVRATINGAAPFGGTITATSGNIQMPTVDTMKSVSVTARTTKTITVSYSSNQFVNGVTTYVVKSNGAQVSGCSGTTCTISGLTAGTTYTIAVNAVNYGTNSAAISTSGATYTAVTTPSLATDPSPTSIVATFSSLGGVPTPATTYQVLLNGAVQSCTTSPCTLSGLKTLSTYTVQVKATNDGTVAQSSVVSVKLWDLINNPTLSAIMYTNRAILSFSVSGGNPSLTRYSITSNGAAVTGCQSIATTTCTVSSLAPATSYSFVVIATNDGTSVNKPLTQSTYSLITTPTIQATTIATKRIVLGYSTTQGVPGGTLYTVNNNGANVAGCVNIAGTTCSIAALTQATKYNFVVTAVNDGKSMPASLSVTTVTEVTTPVVSIQQSGLSLTISYSTQNGYQASVYDVLVNSVIACSATSQLQCNFNSVVLGTKYDVQVKVTNDGTVKTGTASFQTVADTMKTLQVVSYSSTALTFTYSSTYGVQGVTTFGFTINGAPVTCTGFSQCTVSGFTPVNPGLQLTIVGKSINYGNASPTKTITQQLYPVVSTPTFTMSNTPSSISLSFQSTGGVPSPVTTYQVLFNGTVQPCTTSPCTVSGLTTLQTYVVQVKAINDGVTTSSTTQTVTLWDLLTTPTISATMLTKSATLTFSGTGGNPALTRYSITMNGSPYASCQSITTTTCAITSLNPSTSYTFIVTASNAGLTLTKTITASTFSEISGGTLTANSITTKLITISFDVTGGVPGSTRYTLTSNGQSISGCTNIATTTCTLTGLTSSTPYTIQVTATNDIKQLVLSNEFTTYTTVSKPTMTAIGKPTSIFIRYSSTNGVPTPATVYQVLLDGNVYSPCTGVATTCNVNGLTTLSNYSVQVISSNDGVVTQSDSQNLTLWDLMGEPIITANVFTRTIQISYEAPGGDPLQTSFVVTMNSITINGIGNTVCQESKPDASGECNLLNLAPNTYYSFNVSCQNGDRQFSSTLDVQTFASLSNLQVSLDYITTKELSLTYSADNGITDQTFFNVTVKGVPICVHTQNTTCIINGLAPGSTQDIKITAENDGTILTFNNKYSTYQQVSTPLVQLTQLSVNSIEIDYSSLYGIPDTTTYDVLVNGSVISTNTTDLTSILNPLELGSLYHVEVIAYNDDLSKTGESFIQTYQSPSALNFSVKATVSSIHISWNESQYGFPNSTYYATAISYNSQDWITICPKSNKLFCDILHLASKISYVVQVTVYNSFYLPVENSVTVTTLSNQLDDSVCKKNESSPICSDNGDCVEGLCTCKPGWTGIFCHIDKNNNHNGNDTITPNPNNPTIDIENNGITYKFELFLLTEINDMGESVQTLNISDFIWDLDSDFNYNVSHPITGEILIRNSWVYSSNSSSMKYVDSMEIAFLQYQAPKNSTLTVTSYPVSFAGKEFQINIGSNKFTMRVDKWQFTSKLNSLVLSMRVTNPIGVKDSCGNLVKPSSNDTFVSTTSDVSIFNIGDGHGNYIIGSMLNTLIVDTIPMTAMHTYIQKEGQVEISTVIPQFEEFAIVDPDFGMILSPEKEDGVQNQQNCNQSTKKDDKWRIVVGAVVGGSVGIALVAGTALLIRKRKIAARYNKRINAAAQKARDSSQ
ncbi:hypothetical protein PPL_12614 [Heterostelium album PN500]|uniref:Fibronectin type-III domain-containing protein n=1 Tax=Heterostelium pallidum (strain ATCC 26659 / Pp 5 / PN500) TaxID=670386 RepID=D3BN36_HETP5|nr:hypothetical protein PPL_12614 [Heterostelium album PN500]EFA77398.1 hypothetical protein PPL_12614 [Heterostelium album PN500]|eukprot:XP_020429527.1 hypothetical protein PPL_12614 [Heterostelium album PN500]